MNPRSIFLTCFLAILAFSSSIAEIKDYPNWDAALKFLQSAKTEAKPLPLLEKAKKKIQVAKANKDGHKKDALEAVNEAIKLAAAPAPDKEKLNSKINEVIFHVHAAAKNG